MFHKLIIITICCIFLAGVAFAETYSFEWDHNPPSEMVVDYRIWWRAYLPPEQLERRDGQIYGPYDDFVCPDEAISTVFGVTIPCQSVGYTNTATIYDLPAVSLCFVVTALDNYQFESDFSNQVCRNRARFKIINH